MNESSESFIAGVLLTIFVGGIIFFIASLITDNQITTLKEQAVINGAATWVTNTKGDTKFDWNKEKE